MPSDGEPGHRSSFRPGQGLPLMRGWILILLRSLWLLTLILAVSGTVMGGWSAIKTFQSYERPLSELGLLPGWMSDEAHQAQLKPGSQILAVNGRASPPGDPQAYFEALKGPDGTTVQFRVRDLNGSEREILLTRSSERLRQASAAIGLSPVASMIARTFVTGLASLLMLTAAILLVRRRGRDPVAALLSLALLAILAGDNWAYTFFSQNGLGWIGDLFNGIGYPLLPLVLLVFPDGLFRPRWTRWLALFNIVWAVSAYLGASFRELNNLILVGLLLAGVSLLATRYRHLASSSQRLQIKWAMLGFAIGTLFLLIYILADAIRTQPGSERILVWASLVAPIAISTALLAFSAGLLISILRYRLYDAEAAISRSAAFAVLTLMLAGGFAAIAEGLELFFETTLGGRAGTVSGMVAAGLAVALITPLSSKVQSWAERNFQKRLSHLRQDLPKLLNDLKVEADLNHLLQAVAERVADGVGSTRVAILVGPEIAFLHGVGKAEVEQWKTVAFDRADVPRCKADDPDFPLRIPLRVHEEADPLGWLLVGPRPDASLPSRDERAALDQISEPVGRAIRVVKVRSDREAARERRLSRIESALSKLARPNPPGPVANED